MKLRHNRPAERAMLALFDLQIVRAPKGNQDFWPVLALELATSVLAGEQHVDYTITEKGMRLAETMFANGRHVAG